MRMAQQPCRECGMTGAAHHPTCKLLSALPMEEAKLHLEHLLGERDEEIQRLKRQNTTLQKMLAAAHHELEQSNRLNVTLKKLIEDWWEHETGVGGPAWSEIEERVTAVLAPDEKRVGSVEKEGGDGPHPNRSH